MILFTTYNKIQLNTKKFIKKSYVCLRYINLEFSTYFVDTTSSTNIDTFLTNVGFSCDLKFY